MNDAEYFQIFVQSSKYDSEYLESRINEFLWSYVKLIDGIWTTSFTQASIKSNEENIVNVLKGSHQNLEEESEEFWTQIINKDYRFERRIQKATALKGIKHADVSKTYIETFLTKARRINLKINSQGSVTDAVRKAKMEQNKKLNEEFYKKVEESFKMKFEHV